MVISQSAVLSFRFDPVWGLAYVVTQARRVRLERIHPTASALEYGLMAVFFSHTLLWVFLVLGT